MCGTSSVRVDECAWDICQLFYCSTNMLNLVLFDEATHQTRSMASVGAKPTPGFSAISVKNSWYLPIAEFRKLSRVSGRRHSA